MSKVQVKYLSKRPLAIWDNINLDCPVRKFPGTEVTSKEISHQWWPPLPHLRPHAPVPTPEYTHDFNCRGDLMRSQYSKDFRYKVSESARHSKPTRVEDNHYLSLPNTNLLNNYPTSGVYGTTEMRESYQAPEPADLTQESEEQSFMPYHSTLEDPTLERRLAKIDTTYEGFEKYLDIYLTTNRLHHRPFTTTQLNRASNSNDVVTYYTYSNTQWVRRPKPKEGDWWLPIKWPKPMIDREKFKCPHREIITHNKLTPTPGNYKTEMREKFKHPTSRAQFVEQYLLADT